MNKVTELLPCPFCGGADIRQLPTLNKVLCFTNDCDAEMDGRSQADAREKWNTRHRCPTDTGEGWQPIETAPKDGTWVQLLVSGWHPHRVSNDNLFVTIGRWRWSPDARLPHEEFSDDGGWLEVGNEWGDDWGGNIGWLYWKPLATPPTRESLNRGQPTTNTEQVERVARAMFDAAITDNCIEGTSQDGVEQLWEMSRHEYEMLAQAAINSLQGDR